MLEITQLKKTYHQGSHEIKIFNDFNLSVHLGEKIAIMGKSGSGKSTLLSLISGIIKPDIGEINLDGTPYSKLKESEVNNFRASKIGFVFQNFHLVSYLNALENVMLPAKVCEIAHPKSAALELLQKVGLEDRVDHLPAELSGGEKQRVAIARALIHKPRLILADEPSGNLDEETGKKVMDTLFQLVDKYKATLVLVTHSKEVAKRCEKIYSLNNGKLIDVTT